MKNKHDSNKEIIKKETYICNKCNKEFKYRQSKWRHENTCKYNNNFLLIEEVKRLSNKIDQLENNKINNINSNNTINDNRKIIINYSPNHIYLKILVNLYYLVKT